MEGVSDGAGDCSLEGASHGAPAVLAPLRRLRLLRKHHRLPAVFKNALIRRGLPARLFVDNGAHYRSQQLALVCAKLGVALIHARPYQPAGKGKIERWFRTVRAAWLSRLDDDATSSLEALNRSLKADADPERGADVQARAVVDPVLEGASATRPAS